MWLSWERGLWFRCFLLHVLPSWSGASFSFASHGRRPPLGGGGKKEKQKERGKKHQVKNLISFTSLCAILVEFDGDSFVPEVYWLATWSTCSNLSALKPEVFQVWPRFVVECKFWSWSFAGPCIGFNTPLGLPLARWWWENDRWDWSLCCRGYWVNSALWWTLYIAQAALFGWCFGSLLCFVWWFSLLRTFAALICSARFSFNFLWSPLATLAFCNFIFFDWRLRFTCRARRKRKKAEEKNSTYQTWWQAQCFSWTLPERWQVRALAQIQRLVQGLWRGGNNQERKNLRNVRLQCGWNKRGTFL